MMTYFRTRIFSIIIINLNIMYIILIYGGLKGIAILICDISSVRDLSKTEDQI